MLTLVAVLALQVQVADTSPFRALALPSPNRVRSASGAPGPDYWQQRADYVIRATLDTAGSVLHGSERIHYENHSPDTLGFGWGRIEQKVFARARGPAAAPPSSGFGRRDESSRAGNTAP